MFYLAKANVANIFFEDVQMWLDASEIRYFERASFIGHSGYTRHFDFVISKSKNSPPRIIQTINNPTKNKAEELAFGWLDTREARPDDAKAYAFVNDNERETSNQFKDALLSYDVTPVPWSQRDKFRQELAA